MRQRRWLQLIKDYDCEINYHLRKSNIVADALSRKSTVELATLGISQPQLIKEFPGIGMEVVDKGSFRIACKDQSHLVEGPCAKIKKLLEEGKAKEFCLKDDELLTHFKQVCVPENG
jgi:hypothetical protein